MGMDQGKHVFISYVKEDADQVDRLCDLLEAAQIPYWRDRNDLDPGVPWKQKIREAIQSDTLVFLACFSAQSLAREKSYMNEELTLAVEEYRLRPPEKTWLIPVRLDNIKLPDLNLGAGRFLSDLQFVNLYGEAFAAEGVRLTATISRMTGGPAPDAATIRAAVSEADLAHRPQMLRQLTKEMALNPVRRIELDELVSQEITHILGAMRNKNMFPTQPLQGTVEETTVRAAELATSYWELVQPLCWGLQVIARYAPSDALTPWIAAVGTLAGEATRDRNGSPVLLDLRYLPALCTMFTGALAAVGHGRWDALKALVVDTTILNAYRDQRLPLVDAITPYAPFAGDYAAWVPNTLARSATHDENLSAALSAFVSKGQGKYHTPVADWLHHLLRPAFDEQFPDDETYDHAFDRAEVILGIISQDQAHERADSERPWPTRSQWFGRSTWRFRRSHLNPVDDLTHELASQGNMWGPLTGELFGGDTNRASRAIAEYGQTFTDFANDRW